MAEIAAINPRLEVQVQPDLEVSMVPMDAVSTSGRMLYDRAVRCGDIPNGLPAFRDGDVLFAKITPCMENGKGAHVLGLRNGIGFGSTEFHVLRANARGDARFLFYWTQWPSFRSVAQANMTGSAGQRRVPADFLAAFRLPLPPLPEQQKIAAVLSSVDTAIEKTEALIAKLRDLKTAMMQELLTKGIGHTRFKDSPVGSIPAEWEVVRLGSVLKLVEGRSVEMQDDSDYRLVTVKRRYGGVVNRAVAKGREILVKTQFRLHAGDFLVSKRQIVHGACEVVPADLDGATVSNEYEILRPTQALHMGFLRWLSQTRLCQDQFSRNSVGVHIEKMLLKTDDWLRESIPLPGLPEQVSIAASIDSVHTRRGMHEARLASLHFLKKALMQDLLTGRVRVKV
jgi:type I restriction enzyme S subunit